LKEEEPEPELDEPECELEEPDEDEEPSSCQKSWPEELLLLLLRGEAEDSLLLTKPGGHWLEEPLLERVEENVISLGSWATQSPLEVEDELETTEALELREEDDKGLDELEELEEPLLQLPPRTVEQGVGGKASGWKLTPLWFSTEMTPGVTALGSA